MVTLIDNLTARIGTGNAFCICTTCRKKHPVILEFLRKYNLEWSLYPKTELSTNNKKDA